MANYTELIRIHTTSKYSDQSIDFGVFPSVDELSETEREELLELLETLVTRLKNNQYPFSRTAKKLRNDIGIKPLSGKRLTDL